MSIEQRLSLLERQNRVLRWLLVGGFLLVALNASGCFSGGTASSATNPAGDSIADILRARRFEIVDESGNTKFEVSTARDGVVLSLRAGPLDGKVQERQFEILCIPRGTFLSIAQDDKQILLAVDTDNAGIVASGDSGSVVIEDSRVTVRPLDPTLNRRRRNLTKRLSDDTLSAEVREQLSSELTQIGSDPPAVMLGAADNRGGMVNVYNPEGKLVVTSQSNKKNCGSVIVHDVTGKVTNVLAGP